MEDQTEKNMKERFAYLNEVAARAKAEQDRIEAIYGPMVEASKKESIEAMKQAAENERKRLAKQLDPLELIRQVQKMRDEGFDEHIVREAFNEVMSEINGTFRHPTRRITKTDDMSPVMTQIEMNNYYTRLVMGQNKTDREVSDIMRDLMERQGEIPLLASDASPKKPAGIKALAYTALYYLLKYPVKAMLYVLQIGRKQDDSYRSVGGFGMDEND